MYRKQIIQKYLDPNNPLKTDEDVLYFISALRTPILGTKVNCGDPSHTSPFRVTADIITLRALYYVVWANRSGSKTFSVGGFPTWYKSIVYDHYQTRILGGSEGQSKLSYDAMSYFFEITDTEKSHLIPPGLMRQSAKFKNKSQVEILTASMKSVRGPHPQNLLLDEVDEMDEKIYESALSQPQSKHGHPASLGMFSTNHNISGLMDQAIMNARAKGQSVYTYCIWECLESCRDYSCSTCKLAPYCPGIHMKEADGYYTIEDFIQKLNTLSLDSVQRDWFCIKLGYGDLVYGDEWDEAVNMVKVSLNHNKPVTLSIDWGGVDPFSIGVWQKAPAGNKYPEGSWIRVTELYLVSKDRTLHNGIVIREARKKPWWGLIKKVIYDSGRPDLKAEWAEVLPGSVTFVPSDKKSIDDGIESVKSNLKPADGAPRMYINAICKDWIREVGQYRTKKITETDYIIVDKNNHAMDETRYFSKEEMGKRVKSWSGLIEQDISPR